MTKEQELQTELDELRKKLNKPRSFRKLVRKIFYFGEEKRHREEEIPVFLSLWIFLIVIFTGYITFLISRPIPALILLAIIIGIVGFIYWIRDKPEDFQE